MILNELTRSCRRMWRGVTNGRERRGHVDERGVVAVLVVLSLSGFMLAAAAFGVDIARWYLEAQRVQNAADAASLGAVTYMPQDLAKARTEAEVISTRNSYPDSGTSTVTTEQGDKPSRVRVTVCSTIDNTFGGIIGIARTKICRTAMSDYAGPQPMGSPCNVFGNEPAGTTGAPPVASQLQVPAPASCNRIPQFWMSVAGPEVPKENGDQYDTRYCSSSSSSGCTGTKNDDYRPEGEFLLVRVAQAAVGKSVTLQLYDPNYVPNQDRCDLTPSGKYPTSWSNPWVTASDAPNRYQVTTGSDSPTEFCTGDQPATSVPTITSFGLRQPSDTQNPLLATPQPDCTKQYPGFKTSDFSYGNLSTDNTLSQSFHLWRSLCSFTPTAAGDYYLQVRTNVAMGSAVNQNDGSYKPSNAAGSAMFTQAGDDLSVQGGGANRFAVRGFLTSGASAPGAVSVAAYGRMPIYANADSASSTFNLIRVLPGAGGKTMLFTFFDLGDADKSGTVTVQKPTDSNLPANLSGCSASGYKVFSSLTNCSLSGLSSSAGWNGKTETIAVPIPSSYTCTSTSAGGCWFRVQVSFSGGHVTDTTTWTANITGDPVRLVE